MNRAIAGALSGLRAMMTGAAWRMAPRAARSRTSIRAIVTKLVGRHLRRAARRDSQESSRASRPAARCRPTDIADARHRRGAPMDPRRDEGLQPEAAGQLRHLPGREAGPHHARGRTAQRHGRCCPAEARAGSTSAATTTPSRGPVARARRTPERRSTPTRRRRRPPIRTRRSTISRPASTTTAAARR